MKILLAIKSLNGHGGGAERVFVEVANGLHHRGHDVSVLTFDFAGESFYELDPEIERHDMDFCPAGKPTPRLEMLKAFPRMRMTISALRPDINVAFMHSSYVPVALAALGLGVPLIVSEHTDAKHYVGRPLQRALRMLSDRLATIRVVPSENTRRSFLDIYSKDSVVVPNPVAVRSFRTAVPSDSTAPVITCVGVMRPEKGHSVLLDAFAEVADEFPDWNLQIVGDGPLREELDSQVAQLGLGARVEMSGVARDVSSAYARASFVVLPSYYEAFGMVAAEALAAGRAVLSFEDCGGISEIVECGRNGVLVAGSADREQRVLALAAGLRSMMGDPDLCLRLGKAGPDSVKRFRLEEVLDQWESVLGRAVGRPKKA